MKENSTENRQKRKQISLTTDVEVNRFFWKF